MNEEKNQEEKKETEMNEDVLRSTLFELSGSKFWQAVVVYLNFRSQMTDDALRSIDPIKNPTEIARSQGFRSGLLDLPAFIENIKKDIKEKNEPKKE